MSSDVDVYLVPGEYVDRWHGLTRGAAAGFERGALDRGDAELVFDRLGDVPRVLLLHAGGERRRVWHDVMVPLLGMGFGSIAYDQRGHGESGGSRDAELPLFGADTAAMIARLDRPVIVGSSLGGFAALSALSDLEVQSRISGLVLVDVIPDPEPSIVRSFLGVDEAGGARAAQVEDILARAQELREAAARLRIPVLVVRAGLTTPIRNEDAARFLRLVPQASFVMVEDAGHLVARDRPAALAEAIGAFMVSLS